MPRVFAAPYLNDKLAVQKDLPRTNSPKRSKESESFLIEAYQKQQDDMKSPDTRQHGLRRLPTLKKH